MITLLNEKDWKNLRREPYQKYKDYQMVVSSAIDGIPETMRSINDDSLSVEGYHFSGLMNASSLLFKESLELIFYSYSAGSSIKELANYFPNIIEYLKLYVKHHINFHQSSESDGHLVPHLELVTDEYWEALQLVCFSILFAQPEHLKTIMEILAYENDEQDALLDKRLCCTNLSVKGFSAI
nr:PoNe immunity protein domain-containing protein [Acinetobacter baumannii]